MNTKKYALSTVTTGGGMPFFQLTNFLLGIFIVRFLGVQELGQYQFFIVTATFMSYFAKMGGDEKISYTLPALGGASCIDGQSLMTSVLKSAVFYSVILVVLYAITVYFFSKRILDYKVVLEIIAFGIYLPSFVGGLILTSVLRAEHRIFSRILFVYVLPNIFNFIFIVVIASALFTGLSSILARALSYLCIFIFLLLLIHKQYGYTNKKDEAAKEQNNYSWLLVTLVSFTLESGLLAIWAGKFYLTEYDNGVLAILIRLSALVMLVPLAINIVFGPVLAKRPYDKRIRNKVLILNGMGVLIAFLAFFIVAEYFLAFFGKEYIHFINELLILSLGMTLLALTQPLYSVFIALNRKALVCLPGIVVSLLFISFVKLEEVKSIESLSGILFAILTLYAFFRLCVFMWVLSTAGKNKV